MKAAQFGKYGGVDVIEINQNAPLPSLGQGQILIECHAASVNPIDTFIRAGYMQSMIPLNFPSTIAGDFAGKVKEVGSGVTDFSVGEEVFGFAPVIAGGSGAAAEFVAANAAMTTKKPVKASFSEAAAVPLAGVSAVQAITNEMKAQAGQKILIHGGAGGVGSFAIQYAKHLGCYVATTVRGSQKEFAKKLGADTVIDFETEQFDKILKDYDAVLDNVGGDVYKRSFQIVKKDGIVASMVQNPPDQELMTKFGVRSVGMFTQVNKELLSVLADLIDRGVIRVHIDREFQLDKTREAYTYFETGHPMGKVVIRVK